MSQLSALCERLNIRIASKYGAVVVPADWASGTHAYKVTLYYGKRQLTTSFFMGAAHTDDPAPADVLACLASDSRAAECSFEEFCGDFGYDVDSRKAEATYRACVKMAPRLKRFLGDKFDDVANAEH